MTENNENTMLNAAIAYAKRAWFVFPVKPGGKVPITSNGLHDATRDARTIREWWYYHPNANIGINCGKSKLVAVDLDVKHGHDGPGTWEDLRQEHGIDDQGAIVQLTPSGGQHLLFRTNGDPIKSGILAEGIDIKSDGGYIVVAPSRTDVGEYAWELSAHPDDQPLASLPRELETLLQKAQARIGAAGLWNEAQDSQAADSEPILRGQRNNALTSLAGSMRRRGMSPESILAGLLTENEARCDPPLPEHEVRMIVESVSRYTPSAPVGIQTPIPDVQDKAAALLAQDPSDEGNAQSVAMLYSEQFLWCEAYGWLAYTGTHWNRELAESSLDRAVVGTLLTRRQAAVLSQREYIVKVTRATATNVRNAKYLYQSLVPVPVSEFDNFPDLLNCKNGVLDLRTGELSDHSPGQHFTYCIPTAYDPNADFSHWEGLLLDWLNGDRAMLDYLQMAVGYSLTGHTSEECLFYIYGPTRSGKGSFTETILAMLGKEPIATEVDFTTFTAKRDHDSQNFDLAPLKPCRFVAASESSRYTSLNAPRVKALTGGNEIRCAFKHKNHFTYRPQGHFWLSSNYPVNADVDDDAVWYRVQVIEFPNSYAGREDKTLKATLKREVNLRGVLAWATKGAIRWYNNQGTGLRVPKKVRDATEKARLELDYVGQWLDECIETLDPTKADLNSHFLTNDTLYKSYSEWCEGNGITPKHLRSLTMELKRKGYRAGEQKKMAGKKFRGCFGVKVRQDII